MQFNTLEGFQQFAVKSAGRELPSKLLAGILLACQGWNVSLGDVSWNARPSHPAFIQRCFDVPETT